MDLRYRLSVRILWTSVVLNRFEKRFFSQPHENG